MSMNQARRPKYVIYLLLVMLLVLAAYPMIFMVANALKNGDQYTVNPFSFGVAPPFGQFFVLAWEYLEASFFRTFLIIALSLVGVIGFGMLSAYAFARLKFYGKAFLFYAIFGLLLVPGFLTLIPLFLQIKNMGLLDSDWALILPYIAGGQAFAIFVFRTFVQGIPNELFESARLDGANDFQIFQRIVVPLSVPIMITIGLLNITAIYGDYVWPSLVLAPSQSTVAMAIANFVPPPAIVSVNVVNMQFAAYTLAAVPMVLLFLFFMRYFVAGLTSGAIKM
ncbi:MAG: hypothetical protein C7B45_09880 [Sulfobacillus acidophilus]|uniref:ABC transmembrane type-1 domain-containing protein n=1 Tax=Sulfobacillus acidophilus TaxID=53633 RepID=A0A2T2WHI8_9FIRM|nr:MAG: hypothetical protein C7B45_09880 [Sulfobacillus acidophilus]